MREIVYQIRCNWLLVVTVDTSRLSDVVGKTKVHTRESAENKRRQATAGNTPVFAGYRILMRSVS